MSGAGLLHLPTLPGTILETQFYSSSSVRALSVDTNLTALDTTNLTITFVVPTSGKVKITVDIDCATSAGSLYLGFVLRGTSTLVGYLLFVIPNGYEEHKSMNFYLTGLTPGSLSLDLAAQMSASTGTVYVQDGASSSNFSPALIQVSSA